jgi:hypothetical protein
MRARSPYGSTKLRRFQGLTSHIELTRADAVQSRNVCWRCAGSQALGRDQVHQNCPVGCAFAPAPVINADHADRGLFRAPGRVSAPTLKWFSSLINEPALPSGQVILRGPADRQSNHTNFRRYTDRRQRKHQHQGQQCLVHQQRSRIMRFILFKCIAGTRRFDFAVQYMIESPAIKVVKSVSCGDSDLELMLK